MKEQLVIDQRGCIVVARLRIGATNLLRMVTKLVWSMMDHLGVSIEG